MTTLRIALASLRFPESPDAAVGAAAGAIAAAGAAGARIVAFPECFVPGYRWPTRQVPKVDAVFLEGAYAAIGDAARRAQVGVVLGTERVSESGLHIAALVVDEHGRRLGFQDKVQLDPSEDAMYTPGQGRPIFRVAGVDIGVVICHEGWRYPETVRAAARAGAQIVFHPHYGEVEPGSHRPSSFGEVANTFHEKAALCRAAENTIFFATVNCASEGAPTTSAVVRPDGTLQCFQPYGKEGLLIADLDLDLATRFLASRLRSG